VTTYAELNALEQRLPFTGPGRNNLSYY
jgi:hypothetical protein